MCEMAFCVTMLTACMFVFYGFSRLRGCDDICRTFPVSFLSKA